MKKTAIVSLLICLICVSCSRKIKVPTKEEVDLQAAVYDDKGQDMNKNFTKKEYDKLEKLVSKVEKVKKERINLEQEAVKKRMPIRQAEWDKLYAKEYDLRQKVIEYHIKINYDHQTPEVKKRLRKARREANRKARKRLRQQR